MEPYPKGTKLADVHPDFRGMPLKDYLAECLAFERDRSRRYFEKLFPEGPPLNRKRIHTPRDDYGMKSIG
jgi:hypothetical protein